MLQHLVRTLPASDKIHALHESLINTLGNVFMSTGDFNFELALHARIRERGFATKEEIAELHNQHLGVYRGSVVKRIEKSGYVFIRKTHYRVPFYSYPYSFGKLVSRALVARYQKDPSYIEKIEQFLRAGKSDSPERLLSRIGIRTDRAFFEEGIENIRRDLDELRRAAKSAH